MPAARFQSPNEPLHKYVAFICEWNIHYCYATTDRLGRALNLTALYLNIAPTCGAPIDCSPWHVHVLKFYRKPHDLLQTPTRCLQLSNCIFFYLLIQTRTAFDVSISYSGVGGKTTAL